MTKRALVTGASRGIGFETALALAGRGHNVLAVARSIEGLENLQKKDPARIDILSADLSDAKGVAGLTENVASQNHPIHILINNAGALINKPFAELSSEDWRYMLQVNLMAAVNLSRELLPHFSPDAHIVNISSMGGFQGGSKFPGLSAYSVAKGGLAILTECLAEELAERGISVNCLCLGAVQTEMLSEAFPGFEAPVTAQKMGRYIADFALEGATVYNGQIIPVALGSPG